MNSFKWLSNYCFNALKIRTFSSPISRRSRSILLASKNNQLMSFFSIFLSSIINIKNLSSRNISSLWTNLRSKFVNDSGISESSSSHYLIVSSSSTICVKVCWTDIPGFKISCSWRILCNVSSRWNMICCNRITKPCQTISILNLRYFRKLSNSALEEWWIVNICWRILPLVSFRWLNIKTIPTIISFGNSSINIFKHFWSYMPWYNLFDLCPWWP